MISATDTDITSSSPEPYVTSKTVTAAATFVTQATTPWFCVLSFHSGHKPWHAAASSLLATDPYTGPGGTFEVGPCDGSSVPAGTFQAGVPPFGEPSLEHNVERRPYYESMLEAMDTEIGRFLAAVSLDSRSS